MVFVVRESSQRPAVAFAIGRKVGGATVRNRLRRRLRAVSRELVHEGRLPTGWYLVIAAPSAGELSYEVLGEHFRLASAAAHARAATVE